jgi:hypothetical protein
MSIKQISRSAQLKANWLRLSLVISKDFKPIYVSQHSFIFSHQLTCPIEIVLFLIADRKPDFKGIWV